MSNHKTLTPNIKEKNIKEDNIKEIEYKRKDKRKDKRKEVVEIYNLSCPNLPQVQKITDKRNKAIDNFIKEFTIEQFKEICQIANESDFLTGKNDRGWKADFDFIMRTDKALSILEGKYNNDKKGGINDFKDLMEEAIKEDEQTRNDTNNNSFSW